MLKSNWLCFSWTLCNFKVCSTVCTLHTTACLFAPSK